MWALLLILWTVVPGVARAAGTTGPLRPPPASAAGLLGARAFLLEDVPQDLYGQPIAEIRFEGNRRVESDAMRLELESSVGELLSADKLAKDLRRLWDLGYFDDVSVEGELGPEGVVLTYRVSERPTVRKIIIEGNKRVKLDDINEVLDLEKNQVLDLGKVKANVEKIRALYTDEGYFLAEVNYAVRPVTDSAGQVDVVIMVDESEPVVVRSVTFVGNRAFTDKELRRTIQTRVGGYLSVITKRAGGVFNREAFQQDFEENMRYLDRRLGVSEEDFRALVESQLYRQKLMEAITADLPREQEQVWARHILVEDEETAREVIARLEAGEDFAALVREYSIETNTIETGGIWAGLASVK